MLPCRVWALLGHQIQLLADLKEQNDNLVRSDDVHPLWLGKAPASCPALRNFHLSVC